jgi:biopolymer transport protein ExbD
MQISFFFVGWFFRVHLIILTKVVRIVTAPRLNNAIKVILSKTVVHLSSDEAVNYGGVAKVMALIERAGITRVAVLTNTQ